jgi:hypothetical protein
LISKSKENRVWNINWESQSSALVLHDYCLARISSSGNWSELFNKTNEFEYKDNSIVDIEVDCEKKTIYFFINKKQCPYYISDVSSFSFPLLFGFRSSRHPIIEVRSLFKILPSSSYVDPSIDCKSLKWVLNFILIFF